MRRLVVCLFLLCVCLSCNAAASDYPWVHDHDNLFKDPARINERMETFRADYQMDLAVVTLTELNGDPFREAERYYAENGFGYGEYRDGGLLLISLSTRDVAIYTYGLLEDALPTDQIDYVLDAVAPLLTEERYDSAALMFADRCQSYVERANQMSGYLGTIEILIQVAVMFLIAVGVFLVILFAVRNSYRRHKTKITYVFRENGSLRLLDAQDVFLHKTVTSHVIQTNDDNSGDSGRSGGSSGLGGGGGSRKF